MSKSFSFAPQGLPEVHVKPTLSAASSLSLIRESDNSLSNNQEPHLEIKTFDRHSHAMFALQIIDLLQSKMSKTI